VLRKDTSTTSERFFKLFQKHSYDLTENPIPFHQWQTMNETKPMMMTWNKPDDLTKTRKTDEYQWTTNDFLWRPKRRFVPTIYFSWWDFLRFSPTDETPTLIETIRFMTKRHGWYRWNETNTMTLTKLSGGYKPTLIQTTTWISFNNHSLYQTWEEKSQNRHSLIQDHYISNLCFIILKKQSPKTTKR